MANDTLILPIQSREAGNSRDARRLRREGTIPGVLYGLDQEPKSVAVQPADLRLVLIDATALFNVELDGEQVPVLIKSTDRHPVRGEVTHVDFLRVDLTQPIEAVVPIELKGLDDAPGVIGRGVVDHQLRETTISALPTAIPESLVADVSWMDIGDTFLLNRISPPEGVSIVAEHADEIAVVTIAASRGSRAAASASSGDDDAESGDDAGSDES